jgi:Endonuclease domain
MMEVINNIDNSSTFLADHERAFANELDMSNEVRVYAKLPRGFFIPTPVGKYNPDWAIVLRKTMLSTSISLPRRRALWTLWSFVKLRKQKLNVHESILLS